MTTSSASRSETTEPETGHVLGPDHGMDPPATPDRVVRRRRGPVRRLLWALLVLVLLVGLMGAGINVAMVGRLDRIEGAFEGVSGRPASNPVRTFLMIGTRPGFSGRDVPWLEGEQSVEAVMLIDVSADGMSARVETLPQSSGISPVVTSSRPSATVAAVESWSGRRIDHVIAIDWGTFVRLAEDNGVDPSYVYGSGPAVQHDFLRRVMEGTLHAELRKQPLKLFRALRTTADGSAVDDGWSVIELDWLLLSLRNLRSQDITYSMARPG